MSTSSDRWVADASIGWRILLTARPATMPSDDGLAAALTSLYDDQGWSSAPPLRHEGTLRRLQGRLTSEAPHPVLLGVTGPDVVVSAHHGSVDGLGLLAVLDRCGVGPLASSARGLDQRPQTSLGAAIAGRLGEAVLRPPLRPVPPERAAPSAAALGPDALAEREVAGSRRTADLVHAVTRAVVAWQEQRGLAAAHVAIAIGAALRVRPADARLADDSALLRLRDVERLDRDAIADAIDAAAPQPPPHRAGGLLASTIGVGVRLLGPRLGSTLLVSHLGEVSAPQIERMTFHPVTAGGSGLSLGALGHGGRTTLTLRGRRSRWDDNGLEQLLEAVVQRL